MCIVNRETRSERSEIGRLAPKKLDRPMKRIIIGSNGRRFRMHPAQYSITHKNHVTGKSVRLNVIVMENLFYERKAIKVSQRE